MTTEGTLAALLGSRAGLLLYGLPALAAIAARVWWRRRAESAARRALEASRAEKLREPTSLHPVINPNRCLGCGTCVDACPEENVLGLIAGKAQLVNPSHCIGHGACRDACPTDAITLVLGNERERIGGDGGVHEPALTRRGDRATRSVWR